MIELWINISRQASNPIYEDTLWGASTGRKRALLFIFRPYRITDMNERLWRSTVHKRVILENGFPAFYPQAQQNTLLKPKRHSLRCHGFVVHALLLRINNNVVDFRVMRRLCHRKWNWQGNWQSVNHIPGIYDNGLRDHGLWRLTLTAYTIKIRY